MMKLFTKNKKKKDNKGFSLVELIVVIAIMAILAVALAPRLFHYLDKARKSNDNNLINTIGTAVQNALVEEKIYESAVNDHGKGKWFILAEGTKNDVKYKEVSTGKYTTFIKEVKKIVSGDAATSFKLQSDDAEGTNYVLVRFENQSDFKVRLYYDTTITDANAYGNDTTKEYAYEATASR